MKEMYIPEGRSPSPRASMECALAMKYLIDIGWPEEAIPDLEKLWWSLRNDKGRLKV